MAFSAPVLLVFLFGVCHADITWTPRTVTAKSGGATPTNFNLRYLVAGEDVANIKTQPAIVHLTFGDDVEKLANDQAFVYSLALQLKAALYVVEHRYYGASNLTNPAPTEFPNYASVQYMGAPNALADFKLVLDAIHKDNPDRKVLVTGSGYAGELAIFMRTDTANNIAGSVVFGAPFLLHQSMGTDVGAFDKALKNTYTKEGCAADKFKNAIKYIIDLDVSNDDSDTVKKFKTAMNLADITINKDELFRYIHDAYVGLAKQNYDFPHNLDAVKQKFDKRPVKAYCDEVNKVPNNPTLVDDIVKPVRLLVDQYYQTTDVAVDNPGHNYRAQPDNRRRDVIACASADPFHCTQGGDNDDFNVVCDPKNNPNTQWVTTTKAWCDGIFRDAVGSAINLGAFKKMVDDKHLNFATLKNAIYVDGDYSPSSVGIVAAADANQQQYKFVVPGATHDSVLRTPTSCDADNLNQIRYQVVNIARCWLGLDTGDKCTSDKLNAKPRDYAVANAATCTDTTSGYPWNQQKSDPTQKTNGPGGVTTKTTTPSMAPASINLFAHLSLIAVVALIFQL